MKTFILLTGLFAFYQTGYGQCDKNLLFTCHRARTVTNGSAGEEISVEATIRIEDGKIKLAATLNGESETDEGEIKEITGCDWQGFLKNGRMQYRVVMTRENQTRENTLIDIESENGETKISFGSDPDTGSKLQFYAADYAVSGGDDINTPYDKPVQKKKKQRRKPKAGVYQTET